MMLPPFAETGSKTFTSIPGTSFNSKSSSTRIVAYIVSAEVKTDIVD